MLASYKISDLEEEREVFKLSRWQEFEREYKIEKDKLLNIDKVLKFNFEMRFDYSDDNKKSPYFAISKLNKYFKFKKDADETTFDVVFFNFTKNVTDYQVQIDNKQINLSDFKYWTNLNFQGVPSNELKKLAISKLDNSQMMLDFKFGKADRSNAIANLEERLSICLNMKYYYNVDDGNSFEIIAKLKETDDQATSSKLIEYNTFRQQHTNEIKQNNWLELRYCFSNKFIKTNTIYLASNLDAASQSSQLPGLTNAIADFKIKRITENFNDFLFSWTTGITNPNDEWFTTPILDNFKLRTAEVTNQTYLELINTKKSQIDVYFLVSNAFKLSNDMKLTFNLNNNHTDATLKIYLVLEDNKQQKQKLEQIDLNKISEEESVEIDITDSNYESNLAFNAINMDEEQFITVYKLSNDKKSPDREENEKSEPDEVDPIKPEADKKVQDPIDPIKPEDDKKMDEIQIEKSFARLIFEFKLKSFEENDNDDKVERLMLNNVNLMDPCNKNFNLCKHGKCKGDSIEKWHCECNDNAHGDHCEFLNMCKTQLNKHYIDENQLIVPEETEETKGKILNGYAYCGFRKAKGCSPIDNRIMCICENGQFWNHKTQLCEKINSCSFAYCPENEDCIEDGTIKKPHCRCKIDYYRNETTKLCEIDYCRAAFKDGKPRCGDSQNCLNDLMNEEAYCECKFGFFGKLDKQTTECSPSFTNEQSKTPFIKQFYDCDHTYELSASKKEYQCKCLDGWKLENDKRTCKAEFDLKKCPPCSSIKQVCVRPDAKLPNTTKCICKLGHDGANKEKCEPNFCNDETKSKLIKASCVATGACELQNVRRTEPVFQCGCKPELSIANKQSGLCELKNVCNKIEQEKCAETNGYCVPKLLKGLLTPECECSLGFGKKGKDANGKCVPLDELVDCKKHFNAFAKYIDLRKNRAVCGCLPGYQFDALKRKCLLSTKDTIQVSVTVFLKHLIDEQNKEEIPESMYIERPIQLNKIKIFDCINARLLIKGDCFSILNPAYQQLTQFDKRLMMKNIEYQLYQKVRSLFFYIQGDDKLSISMISFKNVTEINEAENGFNTKYLVNIALVSSKIKGENLQENLDKLCQDESKNENIIKSKEFKDFCFLDQRVLPLSKKLHVVGSLNLCNTKTMQCPAYSNCKHENINELNYYSCVCNKGFKSLHKIDEFNLNIEVCEDVDECLVEEGASKRNDCGPNTICDNLIGSYRCLCKENFKRLNETDCEMTCSESFACVHGKCQTFEKHYEVCVCNDGYKGIDCSKEDSLVILLKEILVFVSVGLGLMLVVVIAISVFCIKSVRKQKRKDEDQINLDDLR